MQMLCCTYCSPVLILLWFFFICLFRLKKKTQNFPCKASIAYEQPAVQSRLQYYHTTYNQSYIKQSMDNYGQQKYKGFIFSTNSTNFWNKTICRTQGVFSSQNTVSLERKKKKNQTTTCLHSPMNINRAQPENLQHAEKNRKQHKILPFVCWCLLQQ